MASDVMDRVEEQYADWLRTRGWKVTRPDDDAEPHAHRTAPETSQEGVAKIRQSSLQETVLDLFDLYDGDSGWTTDEVEEALERSHQSASAAVNTLMRKGLLRDSGLRRNTRYGNPAVVWTRTEREWRT